MLRGRLIPAWLGIVALSGMFLMGQDTWGPPPTSCPTGTFYNSTFPPFPFEIETTGGNLSGTADASPGCDEPYAVTGTSDGTTVTMRLQKDGTQCCDVIDFSLSANENCDTLQGTYSYPAGSSCFGDDGGTVALTTAPPEACCYMGGCVMMTGVGCTYYGGVPQGPGTTCPATCY